MTFCDALLVQDSTVWLGICDGLSGYIRYGNETLLLEPDSDDPRHLNHVLYSPLTRGTNIVLDHDQDFGELRVSEIYYCNYSTESRYLK